MLIPRPTKLRHSIASKIRHPHIDTTQVRQLVSAYDLDTFKGRTQFAIGPGRSHNLILETNSGRKVVKRYKFSLDREAILYEHSVLKHLVTTGFAAPRLVLNRNGETFTAIGDHYYAITDFVAGFKYTDFFISRRKQKRFIAQAARALARYHQLIDGFVPQGKKFDGFRPDGQRRWLEYDWHQTEWDKYKSLLKDRERNGTQLERFFLHNIDRLQESLVDLGQRFQSDNRLLPKLVIHGDYGPYNLLFQRGQLAAVLDFECTHFDWRAWEVIGAIYRFAGTKKGIDYDKATTFLSAYQSRLVLTNDEIAAMPDVFRFSRLRALTICFRDYFEFAVSSRLGDASHMVWWMDWMEGNAKELTGKLLECRQELLFENSPTSAALNRTRT